MRGNDMSITEKMSMMSKDDKSDTSIKLGVHQPPLTLSRVTLASSLSLFYSVTHLTCLHPHMSACLPPLLP